MTHMYEHVGDVYFESTRKIGGYATLLQAINIDYNFVITLIMICTNYIFFFVVFLKQGWIYEYFPSIGVRDHVITYNETSPRVIRWAPLIWYQ